MTLRLCAFADEASPSLEKQVEALKRNKISLIELRNINGENISKITQERAKEYAEYLKCNGISVWSIGSPLGKINIEDDFEEHLKLTEHVSNLAKIFETDKVRMFSFFLSDHIKHRDEVIERLNKMVKIASKNNIGLYSENEKDIYCDMAKYTIDILDNVKGLKSIFDPANYIQCGQNIDEAFDRLVDRTDYFHIKDAILGSNEVVPAGKGNGNIEEMIKRIKKDAVVSIEPHLKIFSGFNDIDKHNLKNKYFFNSNEEAFDAAVDAVKLLLKNIGYIEKNGLWII